MKDYSYLHDAEINMLVCNHMGLGLSSYCRILSVGDNSILLDDNKTLVDYCNNPSDAWPIIISNGISLVRHGHGVWCADAKAYWVDGDEWQIGGESHSNPLRAAMIVYLQMKEVKE